MQAQSRSVAARWLGRSVGLRAVQRRALTEAPRKMNFDEASNIDNFAEQMEWQERHAAEAVKTWKNLSIFLGIPVTIAVGIYAFKKEAEHMTHPRPKFVPYDHLRIRRKGFPWGDGNHTLFHNPQVNALPDGYEVPDPNNPNCQQIQEDPPRWD